MKSQELDNYRKEVADQMLCKAEALNVEQSLYLCYQTGQPRKEMLVQLLKLRYPDRAYVVIENLNGRTIKRIEK